MQNQVTLTKIQDREQPGDSSLNRKKSINGIRIRNLNYMFIVVLITFTIVFIGMSFQLTAGYRELIESTDNYHRIEADARMVQAASDDLTRDAQLFVMTGKMHYLDSYFKEANETKRRENAIEDLKNLHVTDSLIQLLEDSVTESMNLMFLEYEAMRYAAEGYGYSVDELPEEVRNTPLPAEAANMTSEELINKAEEIAYGEEYADYKTRIRNYEEQYLEKAISLMDDQQEQKRSQMERNILVQRIGVLMIVSVGLIFFFAIVIMVVYPLNHAVNSISDGEIISPIEGTYEIRYMSATYNEFHRHSMELQMSLKEEAERDALTGVLNRYGYQMVVDRLKKEEFPIAFLILDVDEFKCVNDKYGHAAGDKALKTVADLLVHTFRETDITSRIGGDEFTVIMSDITDANKETIHKKIDMLNETLKQMKTDKCPPLSLSVGCAFALSSQIEDIYIQADKMMYKAKQAGGGQIRFVENE